MAEGGLLSIGDGHAIQGDGEVNGVAVECPMAHGSMTLRLHEQGLGVYCYTVDNENEAASLFSIGVDGIFTNYPQRMLQHFESGT